MQEVLELTDGQRHMKIAHTGEVLHRRRETDRLRAELHALREEFEATRSKENEDRREQLVHARRIVRIELENRAKLRQASLELEDVRQRMEKALRENQRMKDEIETRDRELAMLGLRLRDLLNLKDVTPRNANVPDHPNESQRKHEAERPVIVSGVI